MQQYPIQSDLAAEMDCRQQIALKAQEIANLVSGAQLLTSATMKELSVLHSQLALLSLTLATFSVSATAQDDSPAEG